MRKHSESPQPLSREQHDSNARRSRTPTSVSDPRAAPHTRRHSVDSRGTKPSACTSGGIFVTVKLVGHEGAHPMFETTVTKTTTYRRGSTTVLKKRFGEFRQLYEKVQYLAPSGTTICSKVFKHSLCLVLTSHRMCAFCLVPCRCKASTSSSAVTRTPFHLIRFEVNLVGLVAGCRSKN